MRGEIVDLCVERDFCWGGSSCCVAEEAFGGSFMLCLGFLREEGKVGEADVDGDVEEIDEGVESGVVGVLGDVERGVSL